VARREVFGNSQRRPKTSVTEEEIPSKNLNEGIVFSMHVDIGSCKWITVTRTPIFFSRFEMFNIRNFVEENEK
jgi:hypothetical protein